MGKSSSIIQGSILDIKSKAKFDALIIRICELPIFKERNSTGHHMYSSALKKYSEYLALGAILSVEENIEEILAEESTSQTEKAQLISARIGQGQFRKALFNYWGRCAVTNISNPKMLLASHIKPWSRSNNTERLDKFNGLLLTPNLDRAFDQGYISFRQSGEILISKLLEDAGELGIKKGMNIKLASEHAPYMKFHREIVFKNP